MRTYWIISLIAALGIIFLKRDEIREYLTGPMPDEPALEEASLPPTLPKPAPKATGNYLVNDSIYRWDEQLLDWIVVRESHDFNVALASHTPNTPADPKAEPIVVNWTQLTDIEYELRYFAELDMQMYAPVFTEAVKALDGKEIVIEGFVIPFDEDGSLLALSANPYASCFFCGKASPASVLSLYLKKSRKRYKMDDFLAFKGILELNVDDPNEYYYILREAREVY